MLQIAIINPFFRQMKMQVSFSLLRKLQFFYIIIYSFFREIGDQDQVIPEAVLFIEDITERLSQDFPDLWKLGQAYFKGDLVVEPDLGKSAVFKEMIFGSIRYFCNLIRSAVIPQTFKKGEDIHEDFGVWSHEDRKKVDHWLPSCLRQVRKTYSSLIHLDLPMQALDIGK